MFEQITSTENLTEALNSARKARKKKKSGCWRDMELDGKVRHVNQVAVVDKDPAYWIDKIQTALLFHTYTTSDYNVFIICDRGKRREIYDLPYYPDRIIQWAVMRVIEPIFLSKIIPQSFAAMPGRGQHKALWLLQKYMHDDPKGTAYCLKTDIKHFFPSISHDILKDILRGIFKDPDLIWLLDDIIDSVDEGIPIGNYTSQYLGNIYLAGLDHYMKEVVGAKYYLRYMDDIIILDGAKERLRDIFNAMREYVESRLQLTIKENWQIFPTDVRGVDFVGYRSFYGFTLLRRRVKKNFIKAAKEIRGKLDRGEELTTHDKCVLGSYHGILKWCDSYRLKIKHLSQGGMKV